MVLIKFYKQNFFEVINSWQLAYTLIFPASRFDGVRVDTSLIAKKKIDGKGSSLCEGSVIDLLRLALAPLRKNRSGLTPSPVKL